MNDLISTAKLLGVSLSIIYDRVLNAQEIQNISMDYKKCNK
jgi:hypothetical protein